MTVEAYTSMQTDLSSENTRAAHRGISGSMALGGGSAASSFQNASLYFSVDRYRPGEKISPFAGVGKVLANGTEFKVTYHDMSDTIGLLRISIAKKFGKGKIFGRRGYISTFNTW